MSDVSSVSSGTTGAGGGNMIRLTGLSSGLDVDALVKKMMAGEQTQLDKAQQAQQTEQWKQDAYQDIIKDIKDLQSSFFDSNSSDKNILSSKNFAPYIVTGSGDSSTVDTSVATFTPGVGVQTGKYSITVSQLAEGAGVTNTLTGKNLSDKLTDLGLAKGSVQLELGAGTKTVNITLDNSDGNSTLGDLVDAINNQGSGVVKASFSELSGILKLNTSDTGSSTSLTIKGGTTSGLVNILGNSSVFSTANSNGTTASDITLATGAVLSNTLVTAPSSTSLSSITSDSSVNLKLNAGGSDINISLDNSKTVQDLIDAINSASDGNATASYDSTNKVISLKSNTSTSALKIETGTSNGLVSNLFGLTINDGTAQSGKDANVSITPPGASSSIPVTTKSSNNFIIDGMTYTLSSKGTTSVNVGLDTSKVYDKISTFIQKYNAVVDEIQTKLTEKPDSDYKPLTDAQKAEMSSSQITAWETKAKVGILRNDDNLQSLLDNLTTAFTTTVNNTSLSIGRYSSNSIGIDTSQDYTTPDHIDIVNPSALQTAISTNCDQILKMFTNVSTAAAPIEKDGSTKYDSSTQEYQEDGIFTRFKTILQKNVGYTNTTLNTAILTSYANKQYDFSTTGTGGKNTLPDQLYEQQLKIKDIKAKMATHQEAYYQKFSKLETIMTELNSQQSQLSSMLGS